MWNSFGVDTGNPDSRYLAQITFGARDGQKVVQQWPAPSFLEAQQQANDWLDEYLARIGGGPDLLREPKNMRARWARLANARSLPDLPELSEKYCRGLELAGEEIGRELDDASAPTLSHSPRRPGYASRAKIVRFVISARAAGIDVAGIRVWPDGSIATFDNRFGKDPGVTDTAVDKAPWSD